MWKKLGIGLLLFLFISVLYHDDTLYNVEGNFADRITTSSSTDASQWDDDVKIVAIDEQSLSKIGRWPWSRQVMANVVDQLMAHGAKVVWPDVLYVEPDQNPTADQAWNSLLQKYSTAFMSSQFDFASRNPIGKPLHATGYESPVYSARPTQIGHINVIPDEDGKVRKVVLGVKAPSGAMVPAISVLLANQLLPENQKITWNGQNEWFQGSQKIPVNAWNQVGFRYTAEADNPNVDTQPIYKLLDGEIPYDYYDGAVVLIGPYAPGLQDQFTTPVSGTQPMYGVDIQANIVQALLHHQWFTTAPSWLGYIILLLCSLGFYVILQRLRLRYSLLAGIGVIVLYPVVTIWVFHTQHMLLPVVYPLLAVLLTYFTSIAVRYLQERLERKRITGMFSRYVSKDVVDEILASSEQLQLGGVRRDVSLMFVDIRGFTPLSEQLQPEDVIQILNEYLDLATKAVFSQGGTIDKFIGDGVMAIFGAPRTLPDHTERAVKAAIALREGAASLEERLQQSFGKTVRFGIGIHCGPAVIGNIGSKDRLDYTAIGDTVNLAARLESNAKAGQILISDTVYERVHNVFECLALEPIRVKGKEQLVTVYEVHGERKGGQDWDRETIVSGSEPSITITTVVDGSDVQS